MHQQVGCKEKFRAIVIEPESNITTGAAHTCIVISCCCGIYATAELSYA